MSSRRHLRCSCACPSFRVVFRPQSQGNQRKRIDLARGVQVLIRLESLECIGRRIRPLPIGLIGRQIPFSCQCLLDFLIALRSRRQLSASPRSGSLRRCLSLFGDTFPGSTFLDSPCADHSLRGRFFLSGGTSTLGRDGQHCQPDRHSERKNSSHASKKRQPLPGVRLSEPRLPGSGLYYCGLLGSVPPRYCAVHSRFRSWRRTRKATASPGFSVP